MSSLLYFDFYHFITSCYWLHWYCISYQLFLLLKKVNPDKLSHIEIIKDTEMMDFKRENDPHNLWSSYFLNLYKFINGLENGEKTLGTFLAMDQA